MQEPNKDFQSLPSSLPDLAPPPPQPLPTEKPSEPQEKVYPAGQQPPQKRALNWKIPHPGLVIAVVTVLIVTLIFAYVFL
ncbi:MAG TPA: hypothetical protein VIH52_04350 [Candidatus Nanoarchaeia archaeon]